MELSDIEKRELQHAQNPDSTEDIPTLDIAAYLAGETGALERTAAQLRRISETVGFFYLTGHGIDPRVRDAVFAQARRFNELPLEERRRIPKRSPQMPVGFISYEDMVGPDGRQPDFLVSTYLFYIERGKDNPKVVPNDPFQAANFWPDWLPGFREAVLRYFTDVEKLALEMMPLWATALDLPADFFDPYFKRPWVSLAMNYYPPNLVSKERSFSMRPHTDNTFMTLLAADETPGLSVRMPSGRWRTAEPRSDAFVVNSGNSLHRWTNGRFLSTKHSVINRSGKARLSIPMFFGADLDAQIKCVPTCDTQEHPAQFPPIIFRKLQEWYFFSHGQQQKAAGPDVKSGGKWVPDELEN